MLMFRNMCNIVVDEGKPDVYLVIRELTNCLTDNEKKYSQNQELADAIQQLNAKLKDAMTKFDGKIINNVLEIQYENIDVIKFATKCRAAIFEHQRVLMTAPGLWNQLKAIMNNFLEKYFSASPVFNTDYGIFALKDSNRQTFNEAKKQCKQQANRPF